MNEDELTERLRRARPQTPRRGAPLEPRQEVVLQRILSSSVPSMPLRTVRRHNRTILLAAASVLIFVAMIAAAALTMLHPSSATAATPAALEPTPVDGTAEENMMRIAASVRSMDRPPATTIRFQTWALAFEPENSVPPQSITPEEHDLRRQPDGSLDITVRAGATTDRNGSVVHDARTKPGMELWSLTIPAQEATVFPVAPPSTASAYAEYFERSGTLRSRASGEYFSAVRLLLSERALSSKQQSALIEFLASLPDIVVDGAVTDRLGRRGIAFSTQSRSPGEYQDALVMSGSAGVLSYEATYIGSSRTDLQAPAVIEYIAWK